MGKDFKKKTKFCRCPFDLARLLFPFPLLANKGKSSAGHTKRRKTQREGRKEAVNAVFADGERVEPILSTNKSMVFFIIFAPRNMRKASEQRRHKQNIVAEFFSR
jgi:hypothetical protein